MTGERLTGERLAGRVVLVTGSSRGIGAEIVMKAAAEGAIVAVHYHRSADAAQATLDQVRALGAEAERPRNSDVSAKPVVLSKCNTFTA